MRLGLIGSRPLHLVPLSSLPLHTFPLFFHVLLASCLVISSFSSFARTLVPALVCTCTSTYLQKQVSGRPGLYNEVGFIGCPCALGSPFISTTHTSVPSRPPVMSSFFCLLCAHMCTFALTLVFRLPSGRRVCVCNPWNHRDPFGLFCFGFASDYTAGGMRPSRKRMPTKLCVMVEARSDQPGVPAFENLSMAKAVSFFVVQ